MGHAAAIAAARSFLNHARFVRSAAFDTFLASLACIGGPKQNGLYLRIENLTGVFLRHALTQPSPKLGTLEAALTAVVCTLAASYTLLFSLTLVSAFNLASAFGQALLGLLPPLTRTLKLVWRLCPHLLGAFIWALKTLLALGIFTLSRLIDLASLFATRAGRGLEKPSPADSPFIVRVATRVRRKLWPLYTDELGRSYLRRTPIGGVLALARVSTSSLKLPLKEALGALVFLSFAAVVFSLPTELLTRATILYSSVVTYLGLRVFFKTKPKALRFARGCRLLGAKVGRRLSILWFWRCFGGRVAGARFRA